MILERVRPVHALIAAIAVLLVTWPMSELLVPASWLEPGVIVVGSVAATGMLTRAVRVPPPIVVLGQAVVAVLVVALLYALDTFWYGLPTPTTFARLGDLLASGGEVLRTQAAPAPTTPGVELLVVVLVAVLAVSVDGIAVTCLAPVFAGLPLAAGFLASVSNSGRALEPWYFLSIALAWLALVALEGSTLLREWSTGRRREIQSRQDVTAGSQRLSRTARLLAVLAAVVAVLLPLSLPHLPPTFLADGLARGGGGGASGDVQFAETMDLAADLASQSDEPVVRYTASSFPPPVLRISSTVDYDEDEGQWRPEDTSVDTPAASTVEVPADDVADDVLADADTENVEVLDSSLVDPQIAVPYPLRSLDLREVTGVYVPGVDRVQVEERARAYSATYTEIPDTLPEEIGERVETELHSDELPYTAVPESARPQIEELAQDLVGETTNDLDRAILIQNHFRSGLYAYDLELAPNPDGVDPLVHFLQTRQGYCVQYATGMIMAARSQGIPARMAVGFVPGEQDVDGTRVVLASDAHAWPELWISGLGWTRFEPTPGVRTGPPPGYAITPADEVADDPTVDDPAAQTPPVDPGAEDPLAVETDTGGELGWTDRVLDALAAALPALLRVLAVVIPLVLVLLLLGVAGRRHREEGLRSAREPEELVEGHWLLLTRSLRDLDVEYAPPRSPVQMGAHYCSAARLTGRAEEAMGRITATLERARFAPPGSVSSQDARRTERDVGAVVDAVRGGLPWNLRLTSRLLPASGLAAVRSWFRRGRDAPGAGPTGGQSPDDTGRDRDRALVGSARSR